MKICFRAPLRLTTIFSLLLVAVGLLGAQTSPRVPEILEIARVGEHSVVVYTTPAKFDSFRLQEKFAVFARLSGDKKFLEGFIDEIYLKQIEIVEKGRRAGELRLVFAYLWEGADAYIKPGYLITSVRVFVENTAG